MVKKKKKKVIRKPVRKKKTAKRRLARPAVQPQQRERGDHYVLSPDFALFDELKALVLKSSPDEKNWLIKRISGLGRVKLAIVSGIFLNTNDEATVVNENTPADLFIVADDVNKRKLQLFLKALEAEIGKEIKFGLMEKEEFDYRFGMFDRFVRVLLEGPHEKIINKLGI